MQRAPRDLSCRYLYSWVLEYPDVVAAFTGDLQLPSIRDRCSSCYRDRCSRSMQLEEQEEAIGYKDGAQHWHKWELSWQLAMLGARDLDSR